MQPPLLIDWLRQLHLTADASLASKRWKLAEALADKVTGKEAVQLLRVFLFPQTITQHVQTLTSQVLAIDSEFPASNNNEEIRLIAGIVMVAAIDRRPSLADVFALGLVSAAFPKHRCNPAQRGIVDEMGKYLHSKANDLRPSNFNTNADREKLVKEFEVFAIEVVNPKATEVKEAVEKITVAIDQIYGLRLQRLSEETELLWWFLGGHSTELNQELSTKSADEYALIAAAEAAERTYLIPPPPSMSAILKRALANCKGAKKRNPALKDIVAAADTTWRAKFVTTHPTPDCADLAPLVTALAKLEDSGDVTALPKVLQKACPGVAADLAISPIEGAQQLYNEIMFLRALTVIG